MKKRNSKSTVIAVLSILQKLNLKYNPKFTYLVVGQGISNSRKSFNGNGNRHVDRAHHHYHLSWVQEVGEQLDVDVRLEVEALPEAFQDGSEQVPSVKEGEENQHEVETVNVTQK